jgi:DNA-binding MarR family transcriptional regulator
MSFYNQVGKMAIGSRLRRLSDIVTEDAAQLYRIYGVDLNPKWFPVFYVLCQNQQKSVTEIAEYIGHSHPSVSKIIREMSQKGLVIQNPYEKDGRKNVVRLSKKGREIATKIEEQYIDVRKAIEVAFTETNYDLWKAIEEWEILLDQQSLLSRVQQQKKQRESQHVVIVNYSPKYRKIFKELNEEWISTYFKMEEADHKALDHPDEYILEKGGHIVIALYNDKPVGACALIKMSDVPYDYELAKMAVSPAARGKNIGRLLGQAMIEKAISLGAKSIYLESNTMLKPAVSLYYKLGFKKITGLPSPYERCNIQMELLLNKEVSPENK